MILSINLRYELHMHEYEDKHSDMNRVYIHEHNTKYSDSNKAYLHR